MVLTPLTTQTQSCLLTGDTHAIIYGLTAQFPMQTCLGSCPLVLGGHGTSEASGQPVPACNHRNDVIPGDGPVLGPTVCFSIASLRTHSKKTSVQERNPLFERLDCAWSCISVTIGRISPRKTQHDEEHARIR
jgi:hypothetical protein